MLGLAKKTLCFSGVTSDAHPYTAIKYKCNDEDGEHSRQYWGNKHRPLFCDKHARFYIHRSSKCKYSYLEGYVSMWRNIGPRYRRYLKQNQRKKKRKGNSVNINDCTLFVKKFIEWICTFNVCIAFATLRSNNIFHFFASIWHHTLKHTHEFMRTMYVTPFCHHK